MPRMILLIAGLILASQAALRAEPLTVEAALKRPILDADLPWREVQEFTESRVPPMPEAKSVAEWKQHADRMRQDSLEKVILRGEATRWAERETKPEWLETIAGGPGYRIRTLRFEAVPGLWVPALLYEPEKLEGKVPVVLNVNGHDGNGKSAPYKQIRCINQAKRGMLALNLEWVGMGQLRDEDLLHYRMNQLDLCGTSGLAPFYLSMKRGLDILLAHENADPERVAVAGLSGGGWQTIFISAFDTRVTLANPVAGYSSFRTRARYISDLGDSEQTPVDLAAVTDYAQMTAMLAPRGALLTFNQTDNCCFAAPHALPPLLHAARPVFELYGKQQNLRAHVNYVPGTHNFERDNREALYRMIADQFYAADASFDATEIPSESEVKTAEQLNVPLPDDNANFNSLARSLSTELPRDAALPKEPQQVKAWQEQKREELAEIVRSHRLDVRTAEPAGREELSDGAATFWKLSIGADWTVPAVELSRGEPKGTAILVADAGRGSVAAQAERLLAEGTRVLAVDPFYFGESKISQRDFLYALLVSAVGERPLGVQADQVAAIARWAAKEFANAPVQIVAVGPRSSLYSLVAAGLEEQGIAGLELHGSHGSLKEIIEQNQPVTAAPESFCLGLLERFDVLQLSALAAPRPVKFADPSERATRELKELAGFYRLLGVEHEPLGK